MGVSKRLMFVLYLGSFSIVQPVNCHFKMEAFTEMFLHNVFLHDALAPYKMSFFIPDVFSPLDDPTFNDILNHDLILNQEKTRFNCR